ncbi:MAG TPA: dienelactone hydrolase family protein [Kofleriaceae bacterium]|nr:dienelactone hydrolase family protein [Kofleriaceae bacterium]
MQVQTLTLDVGGRSIEAELYVRGGAPRPGVLLLHELFGLNSNVRADARHLAREGYAVLAPNLYTGGMRRYCMKMFFSTDALMNRSSAPQVQEVHRCLDFLKARPECDGRLGMIGMCLTGGFVLQMARRDDMKAPVVFHHGFGVADGGISREDAARVRTTILGHFAERDPMCPRSRVARLERDLGDKLQAHIYRGVGHGLRSQFRFTSQSAQAWQRTLDFFAANLR